VSVPGVPEPAGLVPTTVLWDLPDRLRAAQEAFGRTGGLHAAGIAAADGTLLGVREDVGRHNALDKLVGAAVFDGDLPWTDRILVLSGRASFELIQKAAMAGVGVVCAIGAPSSLAVEMAERSGITLIGFLRSTGANVYSRADRLEVTNGVTTAS
jgi:FdhD protein